MVESYAIAARRFVGTAGKEIATYFKTSLKYWTKKLSKSQEEREALDSTFARIRAEWAFAPGFGPSELLQHWHKFVQEVEEGYNLSIHDFTFDLSMRDLLEEVKEAVPLRLRQQIENAIRPVDERFKLATQPSTEPIELGVGRGTQRMVVQESKTCRFGT